MHRASVFICTFRCRELRFPELHVPTNSLSFFILVLSDLAEVQAQQALRMLRPEVRCRRIWFARLLPVSLLYSAFITHRRSLICVAYVCHTIYHTQ